MCVSEQGKYVEIRATGVTLGRLGADVVTRTESSLESLRDIGLLRAIENTISGLTYDRRFYGEFAETAAEFTRDIASGRNPVAIDPEGKLEETLSRAQEAAHAVYDALIEKRQSARDDEDVRDGDGLVEEFSRTITVLADLHNKLNELRWTVGEHDADLEPKGDKRLQSAQQIEDALKSL